MIQLLKPFITQEDANRRDSLWIEIWIRSYEAQSGYNSVNREDEGC